MRIGDGGGGVKGGKAMGRSMVEWGWSMEKRCG